MIVGLVKDLNYNKKGIYLYRENIKDLNNNKKGIYLYRVK